MIVDLVHDILTIEPLGEFQWLIQTAPEPPPPPGGGDFSLPNEHCLLWLVWVHALGLPLVPDH